MSLPANSLPKRCALPTRFAMVVSMLALASSLASAQPAIAAVRNGGSCLASLAPGTDASIFGNNLAASTCNVPGGTTWSTTLCNVQVLVNATQVPVGFVSAGQVNFQIPFGIPLGAATVTVVNLGVQSAPFAIQLNSYAPGIAANPGIVHSSGFVPVNAANPTNLGSGDVLTVIGFGFGPTTPAQPAGVPATNPFPATTT